MSIVNLPIYQEKLFCYNLYYYFYHYNWLLSSLIDLNVSREADISGIVKGDDGWVMKVRIMEYLENIDIFSTWF